MHARTRACARTRTCTQQAHVHTPTHTPPPSHTHTNTHKHTHACMYARMQLHTCLPACVHAHPRVCADRPAGRHARAAALAHAGVRASARVHARGMRDGGRTDAHAHARTSTARPLPPPHTHDCTSLMHDACQSKSAAVCRTTAGPSDLRGVLRIAALRPIRGPDYGHRAALPNPRHPRIRVNPNKIDFVSSKSSIFSFRQNQSRGAAEPPAPSDPRRGGGASARARRQRQVAPARVRRLLVRAQSGGSGQRRAAAGPARVASRPRFAVRELVTGAGTSQPPVHGQRSPMFSIAHQRRS